MARRRGELPLDYRLSVLSRVLAAAAGGYALTTASSLLIAGLLNVSRAEAVLTGMLSTFAIYTAAVIWTFAAATATRAWIGLAIHTLVCGALWWLAGGAR